MFKENLNTIDDDCKSMQLIQMKSNIMLQIIKTIWSVNEEQDLNYQQQLVKFH